MSNPHAAQLDHAKRVVKNVMKTRGARQLFNVPVDPKALNIVDYFDVITEPIDLGTVYKRLLDGQKNDWNAHSYYRDAQSVFGDVSRIWSNCYAYNKGPNDVLTREICRKTQHHFETKWHEARLIKTREKCPGERMEDETQVPEIYSLRKESMELPVRLLDAFSIVSMEGAEEYVPLDDVTAENTDSVYATGELVPHAQSGDAQGIGVDVAATGAGEPLSVRLGSIVDWCFQYGNLPGVWLVTKHAWYILLRPAEEYGPYLSGALHSLMTSLYCINFDDSDEMTSDSQWVSGDGGSGGTGSLPDEIVQMLLEDSTVREQTEQIMGKRPRSKAGSENGALTDSETSFVSQGAREEAEPPKAKEKGVVARKLRSGNLGGSQTKNTAPPEIATSKGSTREIASHRKKPRIQSSSRTGADVAAPPSEMDEDDPLFDPYYDVVVNDEEDEDYVNEAERRQRSKKVGESEAQRVKRQKKETEQKRREQEADRDRGVPPTPETSFRLPQNSVGLALSCWDFIMTFHTRLEVPAFPFWRFEAAICPLHYELKRGDIRKTRVQDAESKASALLLQDVHVALCRVLQGRTPFTKDTPTNAVVEAKAISTAQPHWTQSISLFLLKSPIDDEIRTIATFLHGHEYLDLPVGAKLKILYTLINMVVSTDVFREHLNSLVDKLALQKSQPYTEQPLDAAVLESTSLSFERKAAKLSAEKWSDWFLAHRVGTLSSIGSDFRGTHYWVLGDIAGCYKIFVEYRNAYEHSLIRNGTERVTPRPRHRVKCESDIYWGWYEGEAIAEFTQWLKRGGLESEKVLLESMTHIPKPIQLECQRPYSDNSKLNIISLGYHKMDAAMMESYRMDAYGEIRYPLIRGEGEITDLVSDIHLSTRMSTCLGALLATIQFWELGESVAIEIAASADKFLGPLENMRCAKEIIAVMELLCQHGTMREQWKGLRKGWESSLQNNPSLHTIISHLIVLQSFVISPAHSVHRPAFNLMVQDAKCPLYFPLPGESVAVLKTGCLAHLDRYLELSAQTLAAPNTAVCFQQSRHPDVVSQTRVEAEKLPPVEYFRVCCIAYRSPYSDAPPEGVELATDGSLPVQPCMWLLLTPSSHSTTPTAIALPIHVDNTLPDFIVKITAYEQSRRTIWKQGDRFKMFFGGKGLTRGQNGIYYKGTISSVKQSVPGEAYDPWESLTVEWDNDHSGASMKVSPWEIEVDPEEQKKLEEARMRQLENKARQARALAKQQRNEYLVDMVDADDTQSVGDPDYDPTVEFEGGKTSGRSRRRGSALQELVYYDPKNPSGPVPQEMMTLLPGPYEFPILIHNFMQRLKGKFKCPVFSGKDLDLYKVFYEVQNRGGYEVVTNIKLWKDVCRTLNVNLKGQTSASYNMRLNYEKCLLDFEQYLASGRYRQELGEGTAPSSTVYEPFPQKMRGVEAEDGPSAAKGAATPSESEHMVTRGARRGRHSLSMTQLLMGESAAAEWRSGASGHPQSTRSTASHRRSESERVIYAGKSNLASLATHTVIPLVTQGTQSEFESVHKIKSIDKDHVEIQPGESIGMALDRMGWAFVGCRIWRRRPGEENWKQTEVIAFDRDRNIYQLRLDTDSEADQIEWVDLKELEGEELSQHNPITLVSRIETSSHPHRPVKTNQKSHLPTSAPERSELSQLLAPPRALQRYGTDAPIESVTSLTAAAQSGMDPMEFLNQVLRSGMHPEFLKQIVDDASLKRITEEASRDHFASLHSQPRLSQPLAVEQLESLFSEEIKQSSTKLQEKKGEDKHHARPSHASPGRMGGDGGMG